jgi:S1-C subfamily serine protease
VTPRLLAAVPIAVLLTGCGADHRAPAPPAVFQVAVGSEVATAFALGPGRVVTVAHLLGTRLRGTKVRLNDRTARILAIDERDDLALLAVPGLSAPRTRLGDARGDVVVLVVRGDRVRALPARVRRPILARIRTPDGRRVVRRHALELRADVEPGDSGAPVVGPDGRVAGIVFAQSDVREHTAYAVAVSALASPRLRPAGHRSSSTHATAPRSASSAGRNV